MIWLQHTSFILPRCEPISILYFFAVTNTSIVLSQIQAFTMYCSISLHVPKLPPFQFIIVIVYFFSCHHPLQPPRETKGHLGSDSMKYGSSKTQPLHINGMVGRKASGLQGEVTRNFIFLLIFILFIYLFILVVKPMILRKANLKALDTSC